MFLNSDRLIKINYRSIRKLEISETKNKALLF